MSNFEEAIYVVLDNEGGAYVPDDWGRGPSKFGITLATAREVVHPEWTAQDIQNLTPFGAQEFYEAAFWRRYGIYRIDDQALATGVLDRCVDPGPIVIIWLQEIVDVTPLSGWIGPITQAAVNSGNPQDILAKLRERTEAHYRAEVVAHPEKAKELNGWLARNLKC